MHQPTSSIRITGSQMGFLISWYPTVSYVRLFNLPWFAPAARQYGDGLQTIGLTLADPDEESEANAVSAALIVRSIRSTAIMGDGRGKSKILHARQHQRDEGDALCTLRTHPVSWTRHGDGVQTLSQLDANSTRDQWPAGPRGSLLSQQPETIESP